MLPNSTTDPRNTAHNLACCAASCLRSILGSGKQPEEEAMGRLWSLWVVLVSLALSAPAQAAKIWTTGAALMPAWGFYSKPAPDNGSKPTRLPGCTDDGASARNTTPFENDFRRLTWVQSFTAGTYKVYVRMYSAGDATRARVFVNDVQVGDEEPDWTNVGPHGVYRWGYVGSVFLSGGQRHIDLDVDGSLDAVLFTNESGFVPVLNDICGQGTRIDAPMVRARRLYRSTASEAHLGAGSSFVVHSVPNYEELHNDHVPPSSRVLDTTHPLRVWGSADQYVTASFGVRTREQSGSARGVSVTLPALNRAGGGTISAGDFYDGGIDLRVVALRPRPLSLFTPTKFGVLLPDLLLHNDQAPNYSSQGGLFGGGACLSSIGAHESRQFWLTIRIPPGTPAGLYNGSIGVQVGTVQRGVPIQLEVLNVRLNPVEGYYSIFTPTPPNAAPPDDPIFEARLRDQKRHGTNAAYIAGGSPAYLEYAKNAGLTTRAPILVSTLRNTAASEASAFAARQTAYDLGFPDLNFFPSGCDEDTDEDPNDGIDRVAVCLAERQGYVPTGLNIVKTVNNADIHNSYRDISTVPIVATTFTSAANDANITYLNERGAQPLSYWQAYTHFPLWYRAHAGIYNRRVGFRGTVANSYQESVDDDFMLDANESRNGVAYPDNNGKPIPTLMWEAYRAGVDDVRYLQALGLAIQAGNARLQFGPAVPGLQTAVQNALGAYMVWYQSITHGSVREYLDSMPVNSDQLDVARRSMADATVAIQSLLGPDFRVVTQAVFANQSQVVVDKGTVTIPNGRGEGGFSYGEFPDSPHSVRTFLKFQIPMESPGYTTRVNRAILHFKAHSRNVFDWNQHPSAFVPYFVSDNSWGTATTWATQPAGIPLPGYTTSFSLSTTHLIRVRELTEYTVDVSHFFTLPGANQLPGLPFSVMIQGTENNGGRWFHFLARDGEDVVTPGHDSNAYLELELFRFK
jgi:hypothetical protein